MRLLPDLFQSLVEEAHCVLVQSSQRVVKRNRYLVIGVQMPLILRFEHHRGLHLLCRQVLVVRHGHLLLLHSQLTNLDLLIFNLLHEFVVLLLHGIVTLQSLLLYPFVNLQLLDLLVLGLLEFQEILQIPALLMYLLPQARDLVLIDL